MEDVPRWKHQTDTFELAKDKQGWALFHDPGVGKTLSTIDIVRHKMNTHKRFLRTLIFCPPIVIRQWRTAWLRFSMVPAPFVIELYGPGKKRVQNFHKFAYKEALGGTELIPDGRIFITNYESLLMPELYQSFLAWKPEVIVIDESHYVKSPISKRSKLMEKLANPPNVPPYKYLLTGTPATNTPMDLYMQYLILDGGATFGHNFFTFRAHYFIDKNAGMPKDRYFPNWVIRPGAIEEMNRLIYRKANRVEKEKCLDLPPLIQETIMVPMSPEQKRVYNEMKRDLIATIEDKACVATLALTKGMRLQQIASGYVKVVDGEEIAIDDCPKLDALSELLETLSPSGKIIVWCAWRQNYAQVEKLCTGLGLDCVRLVGDLSPTQRKANLERFQKDPTCQVLVANPAAAGMGVDLVEAPYAVYFSRNFSLIDAIQSRARNHRGGSEIHKKIVHYNLVTEETIDELVAQRLESKEEMSLQLLRENISKI